MRIAVFDTFLKMVGFYGANVTMTMNLKGESSLAIDTTWPISSEFMGPIRILGFDQIDNRMVMLDGIGKMALSEKVTYGK